MHNMKNGHTDPCSKIWEATGPKWALEADDWIELNDPPQFWQIKLTFTSEEEEEEGDQAGDQEDPEEDQTQDVSPTTKPKPAHEPPDLDGRLTVAMRYITHQMWMSTIDAMVTRYHLYVTLNW
jgi:hypothetical protein